jgi:tRNA acetyltransferase TAN1
MENPSAKRLAQADPWISQYAIRPTIRHNDALSRDEVIKTVAAAVGSEHTVDLKNYDLLILVEVYRVSQ